MKLFHGSNVEIKEIDLSKGRRGKDFGQGFYLSPELHQAQLMAERTVEREGVGAATITTYEFDESLLVSSDLNIKIFKEYSKEWAEFILLNRKNRKFENAHSYDIIYGPIADDRVGLQISRFQLEYISMEELVRQLSFIRPTFQYFFGTERAVSKLIKIWHHETF